MSVDQRRSRRAAVRSQKLRWSRVPGLTWRIVVEWRGAQTVGLAAATPRLIRSV